MRIAPTTMLFKEDLDLIMRVHGHRCPMVLLGARIGKRAVAQRTSAGNRIPYGFFRGYGCAVDGIQLFTGCTWGNGNLVLIRGRDFSFILTEEGEKTGIQVSPGPELLGRIRGEKSPETKRLLMDMLTSEPDEGLLIVQDVKGLDSVSVFPGSDG